MNTAPTSGCQSSTSLLQPAGGAGSTSSGGSSTGSSSASSTSSNNPWSYVGDTENAESFLQDILSIGLSSNKQSRNTYSDFSTNCDSNGFASGNTSSFGFGGNNFGASSSSGNMGSGNSLGLSGNFGGFGTANNGITGINNHGTFNGSGSAIFGNPLDETINGPTAKVVDRIGSTSMSPTNAGQPGGAPNAEKYQQRVLVAN